MTVVFKNDFAFVLFAERLDNGRMLSQPLENLPFMFDFVGLSSPGALDCLIRRAAINYT